MLLLEECQMLSKLEYNSIITTSFFLRVYIYCFIHSLLRENIEEFTLKI